MSCVSCNLVAHALGWKDGNLIYDTLVCVEVESKASVVLLDDCASTLLDGLGSDTLKEKKKKKKKHVSCIISLMCFYKQSKAKKEMSILLNSDYDPLRVTSDLLVGNEM